MPVSSWNLPQSGKVVNNLYGHTNWTTVRYLPTLHEIEKEWQPCLNKVPAYHWSGAELLMGGWTKWNSAGHPDMLAYSPAAVQPDWYTRRIHDIREADKKYTELWAYDRWDKSKSAFALGLEPKDPPTENMRRRPELGRHRSTLKPGIPRTGEKPIFYGIGSGFLYGDPIRAQRLPPLHDPKHM
ncbi:unnamed protein product [Calicophoron daubneyi]|uniref:Uncharacterized protein n=1 Tax=Calicophoron daubneyi TaxID=300641 RepID=A0AAV2TTJ1_CALDB